MLVPTSIKLSLLALLSITHVVCQLSLGIWFIMLFSKQQDLHLHYLLREFPISHCLANQHTLDDVPDYRKLWWESGFLLFTLGVWFSFIYPSFTPPGHALSQGYPLRVFLYLLAWSCGFPLPYHMLLSCESGRLNGFQETR